MAAQLSFEGLRRVEYLGSLVRSLFQCLLPQVDPNMKNILWRFKYYLSSRFSACILAGLLGTLAQASYGQSGPDKLTSERERAQSPTPGIWTLVGSDVSEGTKKSIQWKIDDRWRHRMETGTDGKCDGFDGANAWRVGDERYPHAMPPIDAEQQRLMLSIATSSWSKPGAPFVLTKNGSHAFLKCVGGQVELKATLSESGDRINRVAHWQPDGEETWTFTDWKTESGMNYASRIEISTQSWSQTISIESASFDANERFDFSIPRDTASNFVFDTSASAVVPMRLIHRKLYVKPTLNGVVEGWFIFDTGTNGMALDVSVAEKHGSKKIGESLAIGGVGSNAVGLYQGPDFQLGPLTLIAPHYITGEYGEQKIDGLPVIGIVGYPYLCRAGIAIDFRREEIKVLPPGKLQVPLGTEWIPSSGEVPCVQAKFDGDRVGRFHLDTGSASFVDFTSPTVRKYSMIANRKDLRDVVTVGVGRAASKKGTIGWFEIGGRRYDKPVVGFQLTESGVFASPYIDGNAGVRLFERSIFLLDLQNDRVAFAPQEISAWYATLRKSVLLQGSAFVLAVSAILGIRHILKRRSAVVAAGAGAQ